MVVLWSGLHSSGDLPGTWRRPFLWFLYFSERKKYFFVEKKIVLDWGDHLVDRGERGMKRE
jgi:hypothetical protein